MIQMENVSLQRKFDLPLVIFIISCIIFSACKNIHSEQDVPNGYLLYEMQNAVENFDTTLAFKEPVLAKEVYDNYIYLYQYDPYALGLSKNLSVKTANDDEYIDRVVFNYVYPHDELISKKAAMNTIIDRIIADMPDTDNTAEKARYIYNSLISGFEYCDDENDCNTAYSALVLHKGNCQSLSKAFVLLCDKAEVDAGYIVGTLSKMPHIWNCITINGTEYQCDLTKGLDEPQNYFMKVSFSDDRIYEQKIDISKLFNSLSPAQFI